MWPIKYVDRIVPMPPPVRLTPLTDATLLLGYKSAGNASNMVDHVEYANVEIEKHSTINGKLEA